MSSFLKGWGRALASQGPWWHRDYNRNSGKKSLDCLVWLELWMSSGTSWSLFPSLNTMQWTLLWSLCLCPCLRSKWQKKEATVTSIFTLVEPERQTESCERGSELQSPSLLFIPSHLYSWKETDATWHVPAAPVFSPVCREPWKLLVQWNINLFYHPLWPKSIRLAILASPEFVKI